MRSAFRSDAFFYQKRKIMNKNIRIFLKQGEDREMAQGFPWVYANEIETVKFPSADEGKIESVPFASCTVQDGSIVEIFACNGKFLGSGVLNKKSLIAVRKISSLHANQIEDDPKFWRKKVFDSVNIRNLLFKKNESCRIVFAEADFLPGLVAERYAASDGIYLVVQFLALACEKFRTEILGALKDATECDFIYERSDADLRDKEGLERKSGWIGKKGSEIIQIEENGVKILVDIANGQKTGYFLDQKLNRNRLKDFCRGKKVLDAFSHTGAFALNAAYGGAKEVVCVDVAEPAVDLIRKNIELNGMQEKISAVCMDAFDYLRECSEKNEKFDVIVLDPPAFTKNAKSIEKAYGGYKDINLRAMKILNEGGILFTCSCSYYFDENTFYSMLTHAAKDSHRRVQVLEKRGAAGDHPILLGYPKSEYLKCAVCRVL